MRVTPEVITEETLPKDTIFVFGSNESGIHGAGAARLAWDNFGAKLGMGFGMSGVSFAIPTKDWEITTLTLSEVKFYIDRFIGFVNRPMSSKWKFYITKIGCGLAGFTPEQIAPFFLPLVNNRKVWLPQDFLDVILAMMDEKATTAMNEKISSTD